MTRGENVWQETLWGPWIWCGKNLLSEALSHSSIKQATNASHILKHKKKQVELILIMYFNSVHPEYYHFNM